MRTRLGRYALLVGVAAVVAGECRQNDDPEGAKQLFAKISAGAGFRASEGWRRAPGYPGRKPSFTAHSDEVEIFINKPIADALASATPVTTWPDGSIVVKEGF